jgi:hypothetical protein
VRDKERLIAAFQSDLEVLSRTDVKSLEQGVKQLCVSARGGGTC